MVVVVVVVLPLIEIGLGLEHPIQSSIFVTTDALQYYIGFLNIKSLPNPTGLQNPI